MGVIYLTRGVQQNEKNRKKFKKIMRYFVPVFTVLMLIGLIPIKFCLGFLGCADIFLAPLFGVISLVVYILIIIYILVCRKFRHPVLTIAGFLVLIFFVLFQSMVFVEWLANHDSELNRYSRSSMDCKEFWFETYEQRCEEREKARAPQPAF
jgi:L-asparagine transporter-like permease